MTTVYFIRHAEPNYENHDDSARELSEKGLNDRKLVTKFLSDKHIDAVLSSPYKRAVDTVADFAESANLEIHIIEDFRERRVGSTWIADFHTFTRKQWANFHYKLADGESLQETQNRNIKALHYVLELFDGKNIAVGSHGTDRKSVV